MGHKRIDRAACLGCCLHPVTELRVWEVFEVVLGGTARTIQVMPLLEDYREFFDFSPDWPGEKNGALRERKESWKIQEYHEHITKYHK